MTIKTTNKLRGQNDPEGRKRVARVLDYVIAHPRQTAHQVSEALDMDLRLVGYALCNLARRDKLQNSGMSGRRMTYSGPDYVVEPMPVPVRAAASPAYLGKPGPISEPRVKREPYKGEVAQKYVRPWPVSGEDTGRKPSDYWSARDLAILTRAQP